MHACICIHTTKLTIPQLPACVAIQPHNDRAAKFIYDLLILQQIIKDGLLCLGQLCLRQRLCCSRAICLTQCPSETPLRPCLAGGALFLQGSLFVLANRGPVRAVEHCCLLRSLALTLALALYSSYSSALHQDLVHLLPYTYPSAVIHIDRYTYIHMHVYIDMHTTYQRYIKTWRNFHYIHAFLWLQP